MGSRNSSAASGGDAEKLVETALRDHPVVMFSKTYCPFCAKGKEALRVASSSVSGYPGTKIFELDRMGTQGSVIQDFLESKTGRRSVPNVFVGGKSIGGGDETAQFQARGALAGMLRDAVAAHGAKKSSVATVDS